MNYPTLRLKKGCDRRLKSGHVWLYSNEIDTKTTPLKDIEAGDLCKIQNAQGDCLGIAYINPNTLLTGRLLTQNASEPIDVAFFVRRLKAALSLRESLFQQAYYRWVFSESDQLPGLILDRFNDIVVGQLNTSGMERLRDMISKAIQETLSPKEIIWRNDSTHRKLEGLTEEVSSNEAKATDLSLVKENNCEFYAPLLSGQKTGWFYDHRENRAKLTSFVKDKTVLDVFSYLGAFAIPQAKAGAQSVTCIDISAKATELIQKNATLNEVAHLVECITADAFTMLKELKNQGRRFDVIILDPPAFIKSKKDIAQGTIAYLRLNQLAIELLSEPGILLTASCSMHLKRDSLLDIIRRSGLKSGKIIQILTELSQDKDHPLHPSIEETHYLKGFICSVRAKSSLLS